MQTSIIVLLTFFIAFSTQRIDEKLQDDLFRIYKNLAVTTRDDIKRDPVTPDKVSFFLTTKKNPNETIQLNSTNLVELYNPNATIVFIIHGWMSSKDAGWFEDLKNAFLAKEGNYYVVQVDWKEAANDLYGISSINTYDVAKHITNLIKDINQNGVPLDNVLLIGHSLGGQVCGFIGKFIQKQLGKKLPRIVALDPAGPLFLGRPEDKRLNKNDADVVEVLHTDGGVFGYPLSCGTLDFFANGGSSQTGCKQIDLADISTLVEPVSCDHQRAYEYFVEAVLNPGTFEAQKCSSWLSYKLGKCEETSITLGDFRTTASGNYYFDTNKNKPFSRKIKSGSSFNILKVLQH